jgi:hypothetical protein
VNRCEILSILEEASKERRAMIDRFSAPRLLEVSRNAYKSMYSGRVIRARSASPA